MSNRSRRTPVSSSGRWTSPKSTLSTSLRAGQVLGEGEGGAVDDLDVGHSSDLSLGDSYEFFDRLELSERDAHIAERVLKEIRARIRFLLDVGLDYLTLSRSAATLAGEEAQPIRLATQIWV